MTHRRGAGAVVALVVVFTGFAFLAQSCSGDSGEFRRVFVDRVTYGDPVPDPPVLTDKMIDQAVGYVCVGESPSLDRADAMGEIWSEYFTEFGPTDLSSGLYDATKAVGC